MKKYLNDIFILSITSSMLYLLIGIFFIIFPQLTIHTVAYLIGISILINGIIGLFQFFCNKSPFTYLLAHSVFCIVLSISVFANTKSFINLFPIIIGILLLITGIYRIKYIAILKNNNENWLFPTFLAILIIIFGILIIFNPFSSSIILTRLIGFYLIIYAVLNIIDDLILKKHLKDTMKFFKKYLK